MSNTDDTSFKFVNNLNTREILVNAYQAIQLTEMWNFMKKDITTYMWGKNPEITNILNKMSDLGYGGHSGSSFGWTMRQMQYIAQHGEDDFMDTYLANNK